MQRWAAGAPSPDVAIPAEPIRCLGRVLWGKQKRGLDSVWVRADESFTFDRGITVSPPQTREMDAMQSRTLLLRWVETQQSLS
jgi:hypothetical protein